MPNIWGDIATWIGAISAWVSAGATLISATVTCLTGGITLITLMLAFFQIANERNERKNTEEKSRKHEKRDQAEHIAFWIAEINSDHIYSEIVISNQSLQPIYGLVINIILLKNGQNEKEGLQNHIVVSIAPPGNGYISTKLNVGDFTNASIEAAFIDTMGVYWLRKTDGTLSEIKITPIKYYDVHEPYTSEKVYSESPNEKERREHREDIRDITMKL